MQPVRRILPRIGGCILSYVAVFSLCWIVVGLLAPRVTRLGEGGRETLSFWESLLSYLELGCGMFILTGLPSLLITILAGLAGRNVEPAKFRGVMAIVLLVPAWPILAMSSEVPALGQVAVQVGFAMLVMPVPLVPRLGDGSASA